MRNDLVCGSKNEALALLGQIILNQCVGPERAKLESVAQWVRRTVNDIPSDPEQRSALELKLETELRNNMGLEERRAHVEFYLSSIISKPQFVALGEKEQTEFLRGGGLVDDDTLSEEAQARIKRIYDDLWDEGNRKSVEWDACGGQPPHGTRVQVPFLFNADKKVWELENEMPPIWVEEHYLPKSEELGI
jgi:hypothetical protein